MDKSNSSSYVAIPLFVLAYYSCSEQILMLANIIARYMYYQPISSYVMKIFCYYINFVIATSVVVQNEILFMMTISKQVHPHNFFILIYSLKLLQILQVS